MLLSLCFGHLKIPAFSVCFGRQRDELSWCLHNSRLGDMWPLKLEFQLPAFDLKSNYFYLCDSQTEVNHVRPVNDAFGLIDLKASRMER